MKNWKRWTSTVTLAFLPCWADVESDQEMNNLNERLSTLEYRYQDNCMASSRAENGIDLFAYADLLVWKVHEDGIPIAIRTKNPFGADHKNFINTLKKGKIENLNFDWDAGFRV